MSSQSKPPYGPQFIQAIEFLIAWGERRRTQQNDAALVAAESVATAGRSLAGSCNVTALSAATSDAVSRERQ